MDLQTARTDTEAAEPAVRSGSPASWHELLSRLRRSSAAPERRVLVVDSDVASRRSFQRLLPGLECQADIVEDEVSAFSKCLEFTYDLILVELPEGGSERMKKACPIAPLRALQPSAAFLMTQPVAQPPPLVRTHDSGIVGLVHKPWDRAQLLEAMARGFSLARSRRSFTSELRHTFSIEYKLLLVGGEATLSDLQHALQTDGVRAQIRQAHSLGEASTLLGEEHFDVVLTELSLPDSWGLDAVVRLNKHGASVPVIVFSRVDDLALLSEAIQAGAQDYLCSDNMTTGALQRSLRCAIERQHASSRLTHLAHHDPLTKLANRTLFEQRLVESLARASRKSGLFAVMYIDLDHFKPINDRLGHAVGDAVLEATSRRLQNAVREYDTVARLGGDEFAILLDTLERRDEAELIAKRVRSRLTAGIQCGPHEVFVTASLGVAVYPDAGERPEELIKAADRAMYESKRNGRNQVHVQRPSLRLIHSR